MGKVKSDIEIARQAKMKPIQEILNGLNVPDKAEVYSPIGRYIAKIKTEYLEILKNPYSSKITIPSEYLRPPNDSEKVLQTFCGT